MSALDFNQRIRFEKRGPRDPEYNTPGGAWLPVAEVWAKVEDAKPGKSETTQKGLRLAVDSATVWIRYREGITPDMRIVELDGSKRTLSITGGPAAIRGRRELEFTVEKFSS